ncbi:hypothetical protein D1BOALGB6SA_4985 [Olavius sp. associated proteobacterium Delta 1]|nr:hypothetical protein D1BOALGB6SA_4985 [Olavius sp. associated proteobacterium Delta 1]
MNFKKTALLALTAILLVSLLSGCVLADSGEDEGKSKVRLGVGITLVLAGFVAFAKMDGGSIVFLVFATQGVTQIIEYLI